MSEESGFPVLVEFGKNRDKAICEIDEISHITCDKEGKTVLNFQNGDVATIDEKYETSRDKYKAAMENKYGTKPSE